MSAAIGDSYKTACYCMPVKHCEISFKDILLYHFPLPKIETKSEELTKHAGPAPSIAVCLQKYLDKDLRCIKESEYWHSQPISSTPIKFLWQIISTALLCSVI